MIADGVHQSSATAGNDSSEYDYFSLIKSEIIKTNNHTDGVNPAKSTSSNLTTGIGNTFKESSWFKSNADNDTWSSKIFGTLTGNSKTLSHGTQSDNKTLSQVTELTQAGILQLSSNQSNVDEGKSITANNDRPPGVVVGVDDDGKATSLPENHDLKIDKTESEKASKDAADKSEVKKTNRKKENRNRKNRKEKKKKGKKKRKKMEDE